MNTTHIQLKKQIMRRVYTAWAYKQVTSAIAMKVYLLVGLLTYMVYNVSFTNVFLNAPALTNVGQTSVFFTNAFLHTELIVQISLLGVGGVFVFLLRDLLRRQGHTGAF